MVKDRIIRSSFGLFYRFGPRRIVGLFLITLLQSFSQGVTILLLTPLLQLLNQKNGPISSQENTERINAVLTKLGLPLNLGIILLLFVVVLFFVALLNYFQTTGQNNYQQDFSYEMRRRLFKKIVTSDWTFLNGKSKHNHLQILTTEIPKMTTYYYYFLNLTSKILFIAAHVVVALMVSVPFTGMVVLTGVTVSLILRKYLHRSETIGNANVLVFKRMLKRIDDFWLTVKIAKVHQSELFYFNKYNDTNKKMRQYQQQQVKNRATSQLYFTLAGILTLVFVVYWGYSFIGLSIASLLVLILLFARIFPQFAGLNNDLNIMVSNKASVRMVLEMDRSIPEKDFRDKTDTAPIEIRNQIEIRNLTFGYSPKRLLFEGFSTVIPARSSTAITGKSGCGKTTLIDLIAGLQNAQNPFLHIDGEMLREDKTDQWKRSIGYLPQDAFFVDGTLRENLIWDSPQKPDDEEIYEVLEQVNAKKLVLRQKDGLDTYIANYSYHFSGGERQRLALARVLLRKPRLLLLDEATSALDAENERIIVECLNLLKRDITIIFVTHREYLKPCFDQCIELKTH